jgi:hypothetical protein
MKLSSDGGESGSKKSKNETMVSSVAAHGGECVWWESAARQSISCWCFCQESGFTSRDDAFTLNSIYEEMPETLYFQCDLQR